MVLDCCTRSFSPVPLALVLRPFEQYRVDRQLQLRSTTRGPIRETCHHLFQRQMVCEVSDHETKCLGRQGGDIFGQ